MPEVLSSEAIQVLPDPTQRLLSAGARLLVDDGLSILSAGFSPEAVTACAGRTRRVFYDHFDTKEDYCRKVLLGYLEIGDRAALSDLFQRAFGELVLESDGDMVESVRAFSAVVFEAANLSAEPLIRAIALTLGHKDPQLSAALAQYNRDIDGVYAAVVEDALVAWSRKMRAPWTPRMLAMVMRGMAESFFGYNAVDPGVVDHELFSSIVLTVIAPILAPLDEPDQRVEADLVGISRTATNAWRERQNPMAATNTRKVILDALEPCLQDHGIAALTLHDIADRAGVSTHTLLRAFGSVDDIVEQAVTRSLPALEREAAFDLATPGLQTPEALTRHFTRLTRWSAAHPWLARAALGMPHIHAGGPVPQDVNEGHGGSLIQSIARPAIGILDRGVESGELAASADTVRTGRVATNVALSDTLAHSPPPAEVTVSWLVSFVLDGTRNRDGRTAEQAHHD